MELRRHFDWKALFIGLYVLAFAVYIVVGLQPAEAAEHYNVTGSLSIPSINLDTDVTTLTLEGQHLNTPDTIAGSYSESEHKTLLIGHSTTVFTDLHRINLREQIYYNGDSYEVTAIDMTRKARIDMGELLSSTDRDTLVIMTCAGELLTGGDATHRLIVTAVKK